MPGLSVLTMVGERFSSTLIHRVTARRRVASNECHRYQMLVYKARILRKRKFNGKRLRVSSFLKCFDSCAYLDRILRPRILLLNTSYATTIDLSY